MFDMPIFEPTEPFRESMYMTGYQASITVYLQQGEGRKPSQDTHLARARCQITAKRHFGENHTRRALDYFQSLFCMIYQLSFIKSAALKAVFVTLPSVLTISKFNLST